ncbi:response regulator [Psychroflexus salis]|uniref:DNA-binding response regulator n=1 Tax=Psychroflexus salis TaxID=1526574 RepID=A0A916ZPD3_9FLAO|nr:response regulator transcription factor [Psychroflexus salis]GGE06165.1 DNA-binding response regulator [Psychroflexus salis]
MIRIAIADDHQSLIDGMLLMFSNFPDMEVVLTGNNGKEILDQIPLKKPDVILTDIKMPVMDGIELCSRVKQEYPQIKIIAFTMFTQDEPFENMKKAGVNGYILKNAHLTEIIDAIQFVSHNDYFYRPNHTKREVKEEKQSHALLRKLTQSEQEILKHIAQGKSSAEIAEIRYSAISTVEKHRKNMMRKLNLNGKGELIKFAFDLKYEL